MKWAVEYTDEFGVWWGTLKDAEQDDIAATVGFLQDLGPRLGHPRSSEVKSSRHGNMRELRIQHAVVPYRVLYTFDPRRCAILRIGGKKKGNDRWYEKFVPIADILYDEHIKILRKEGNLP